MGSSAVMNKYAPGALVHPGVRMCRGALRALCASMSGKRIVLQKRTTMGGILKEYVQGIRGEACC